MKDKSNNTEKKPSQSHDEDKNTGRPADRFKRLLASYHDENLEMNDVITNLDDKQENPKEDIVNEFDTLSLSLDKEELSDEYFEDLSASESNKHEIKNTVNPQKNIKNPKKQITKSRSLKDGSTSGCFIKGIILMLFGFVVIMLLVLVFSVYKYFSIAATLPDIDDLKGNASQFETTRIFDRNGDVLYEILDPNAGRRTYVELNNISPYLIATTIATEDKEFYNHPGFNPIAIARALMQNIVSGGEGPGASTITQQLARNLLFSPVERTERTYRRKAREIILAAEITRKYSKDEILELYLNENYYGNLSYGVQAAAETYFNTSAGQLTLAQSAFLAGLPQAPSVYDIYTNREDTLNRHKQVLLLTYELSQSRGCIEVSNNAHPVCVSAEEANQAARELEEYEFELNFVNMKYPHWVNYIRTELEELYDPQTIYRSGFNVYTTLDPVLQTQAQNIVKNQISLLTDKNAGNGALVAIEPRTGEILSMVGSADFYNETISGQINMTVSPRQPGSSIKPLTYLAAFEKGWTPATLIWDVETEFPPSGREDDLRTPYVPVNYDESFHGPVTVRDALANSYNIPAVKTLDFVGIYDDPQTIEEDGFIKFAERLGIRTLTRDDYGLSLTLGGGDVSLLELSKAYAVIANEGKNVELTSITKITDFTGNVIYEHENSNAAQLIRKEHAFLISSILSDNEARTPMFGADSVLNLPYTAAVKTGTTNDYRDNWTIGFTPDIVVGVWVGNADYTPMQNTTGLSGAAPIWSEFIQYVIEDRYDGVSTLFNKPDDIVEKIVCKVSGTEPSPWCPEQKSEYFAYDQLPLSTEEDLWQQILVDSWTGLRVSSYCSDFTDDRFVLNVKDKWAKKWIQETDQGRAWANENGFEGEVQFIPDRSCTEHDPRPFLLFAGLSEGQSITENPLDIYALAYATDKFDNFSLDYGIGSDPNDWNRIVSEIKNPYEQPELIYTWDLNSIPTGEVTLRLYMKSTENTFAERKILLNILVPTMTPTVTSSATFTETLIPSITETLQPTSTKTFIHTVTSTP